MDNDLPPELNDMPLAVDEDSVRQVVRSDNLDRAREVRINREQMYFLLALVE
jgi:hypothetical protein